MKKEVTAIIAVAAIHFTVNQALVAQQITIHLRKIHRIGKSNTDIAGLSINAIGQDRISGTKSEDRPSRRIQAECQLEERMVSTEIR
jgi:hypothetical protein